MINVEFEGEWMYNPLLWNILVVWIDGDDYIILRKMKLKKNTVYKSKETFLDSINPKNARNENTEKRQDNANSDTWWQKP